MKLRPIYLFETRVEIFFISISEDGHFHPVFDNEGLGSYNTAVAAAVDLAGGQSFSASGISDAAVLDIPADAHEWQKVRAT